MGEGGDFDIYCHFKLTQIININFEFPTQDLTREKKSKILNETSDVRY